MRILFLQQQPCVRALKYAIGLRSTGRRVELGFAYQGRTLSEWYGTGDEAFDHWWRLAPEPMGDLARVVAQYRPQLIHCHNLPDALTVAALDVVDGAVPVIHDSHDLQSLRHTPYEDGFPEPADPLLLEKLAIDGCAALVVVSDEMRDAVAARHGLPDRTETFPNYALERDLPPFVPPPDRGRRGPVRVVYQGTLSTNGGHYDLRDLFTTLVGQGVHLDIYPGRPAPAYQSLAEAFPAMTYHSTLRPQQLLQILPEYDWGWAGFNATVNPAHLDTALPNKLFDYVGCGLPVLTLGHRALARFVAEEGVGLELTTLDGLAARLQDADMVALRGQVAAARIHLTVEANIDRIAALYGELVK